MNWLGLRPSSAVRVAGCSTCLAVPVRTGEYTNPLTADGASMTPVILGGIVAIAAVVGVAYLVATSGAGA